MQHKPGFFRAEFVHFELINLLTEPLPPMRDFMSLKNVASQRNLPKAEKLLLNHQDLCSYCSNLMNSLAGSEHSRQRRTIRRFKKLQLLFVIV